jgi:hypothetical protein
VRAGQFGLTAKRSTAARGKSTYSPQRHGAALPQALSYELSAIGFWLLAIGYWLRASPTPWREIARIDAAHKI